jgi:predicted acyltransferase
MLRNSGANAGPGQLAKRLPIVAATLKFSQTERTSSPRDASSALPPTPPRLKSIDVFRGATIAAMILVNAQFSREDSYSEFAHAAWHGWTFADTIFPCFLFIVGVSLTLSTASRLARGENQTRLLWHAMRRSVLLFACGLAIDYLRVPVREFPFVGFWNHLQISGVLQMIAVCYLGAFLIYRWTGLLGVIVGIVVLNLLYLGLLHLYPVPGCGAGSLDPSCNFPNYIDQIVLGSFRWDIPQAVVGAILPATGSVLFGVLAGEFLRSERRPRSRLPGLLGGGAVLIAAGELMSMWIPINKQLWTTSFAVFMAGLAAVGLACSIWLVDGSPKRRWFRPLEILGSNAIAAYLISRLVQNLPRVHVLGLSLYTDVLARVASPPNASMLFAMVVLATVYLAVWFMDRRGWYLKI